MNENLIAVAQELFDPATRRVIRENPRQYAIDKGMISADSTVQIKLVVSGAGKMAIPILKTDLTGTLNNEQLRSVAAGGAPSTISTGSTLCSTLLCFGSVGEGGTP